MWAIVCADLSKVYTPVRIILSNKELMAERAVPGISVSELHGIVCGFCVTHPHNFSFDELVELCGREEVVDFEILESFVQASIDELIDETFVFSPLIPEELEGLEDRIVKLAEFCSGFLGGFGAGVALLRQVIPEELEEILEDFTSISAISGLGKDELDDEGSYVELHEYVKVSVLLAQGVYVELENSMIIGRE